MTSAGQRHSGTCLALLACAAWTIRCAVLKIGGSWDGNELLAFTALRGKLHLPSSPDHARPFAQVAARPCDLKLQATHALAVCGCSGLHSRCFVHHTGGHRSDGTSDLALGRAWEARWPARVARWAADADGLGRLDPQKARQVRGGSEAAEFVKPAIWNKAWFRVAALSAGGAVAGHVLPGVSALHLTAYGVWLGTNVWTTFIAGLTMFKSLPRQQFGQLQAVLFPKYFQLGTVCAVVMVFTSARLRLPMGPSVATLVFTLANLLYLEPKATDIMFQRYERENKGISDPVEDKRLKDSFGKLHGMSSLANLVALAGLVTHGALLAARL